MQEFYENNGKFYCNGCGKEMTLSNGSIIKEGIWCRDCKKFEEYDSNKSKIRGFKVS